MRADWLRARTRLLLAPPRLLTATWCICNENGSTHGKLICWKEPHYFVTKTRDEMITLALGCRWIHYWVLALSFPHSHTTEWATRPSVSVKSFTYKGNILKVLIFRYKALLKMAVLKDWREHMPFLKQTRLFRPHILLSCGNVGLGMPKFLISQEKL